MVQGIKLVLKRINAFFRSFSFRVGLLILIALCTLISLRLQIYQESINAAENNIRSIINAHAEEIDQGMRRYGVKYVRELVDAIIDDTQDKHLYLTLYKGKILAGNLEVWPLAADYSPKRQSKWQTISIPSTGNKPPINLLVHIVEYPNNVLLLIGYNLQSVELLEKALIKVLVGNIVLSFFVSFILSIGIVWLINRYLRHINTACNRVIEGNLNSRVTVNQSNDQFNHLGLNINRMLDWINTLLNTIKESSNALAHDMLTPLSRHRLELRALADDPSVPNEVKNKISHAVERVDTLVEMFNNILTISKAESRSGTELFEIFDLATLTRDVVEFYDALFEQKSFRLTTQIPETPLMFCGDKQLISQAIINLVDNAIKYTQEKGEIDISLAETSNAGNEEIQLTVSDNGPGIPEELREKAKERFFRLDKSRHTHGTGLGLSLVKAVAGLHHGELVLENNYPGLKATLVFRHISHTILG